MLVQGTGFNTDMDWVFKYFTPHVSCEVIVYLHHTHTIPDLSGTSVFIQSNPSPGLRVPWVRTM